MTVGRMTLGRMTLGRMTLGRMTLGRMTVGRMTLGRMTLGRMTPVRKTAIVLVTTAYSILRIQLYGSTYLPISRSKHCFGAIHRQKRLV
jgi:hypothetical protein